MLHDVLDNKTVDTLRTNVSLLVGIAEKLATEL